jgi:hypothetical protein
MALGKPPEKLRQARRRWSLATRRPLHDGVIEIRRGQEPYGSSARRGARGTRGGAAEEVASAVRRLPHLAGGDLQDDCAIVVARRI